ncbi:MAG: hypothetical protein PUD63_06405 [Clostridia bacterium]|nr:hypothetical protein [Clostridia bacterium]
MLREGMLHVDWGEMTMSMMREKQFEACERRLFAYPSVGLFSQEATELDAMRLLSGSFEKRNDQMLTTLSELRQRVMFRLPLEAQYVSVGEMQLLERLLMNDGEILLGEWDDIGAAEALVRRLWCSFRADGEEWTLMLPKALHESIMLAIHMPEMAAARERVFRFEATIHGLLYIAGLLHSAQPVDVFMREVMRRDDDLAMEVALRYLQSTFEYVTDANGDLILLHPGLADPYRMFQMQPVEGIFTLELSQEVIAGGMNGILPEEIPLHEMLCGALRGALRPEFDLGEAAEDLRMLAKQGVELHEMEEVMASMLSVLPTQPMKDALKMLYQCTPHWMGLKTALVQ